jgi:hypothetical protein
MTRMARILLVEAEEPLRQELERQLGRAGHEVASVPDVASARYLLEEGLHPDVVVAESIHDGRPRELRELVPGAVHLRIVRPGATKPSDSGSIPGPGTTPCSSDPGDVLRRLEEVLLDHGPLPGDDVAAQCMDLARRLSNSLPRAESAEERIELVTEGFDGFFGVEGTFVVRRGRDPGDWIEASQGLDAEVAARISAEIERRSAHRDIRPFLTRVSIGERSLDIACLAVEVGERETDLALVLERAPTEPGLRESLMNLVGSAMRAAISAGELARNRMLLDAHRESFRSLLEMSRELSQVGGRRVLGSRLLSLLHRELSITRAAVFVPRAEQGMLDLLGSSGFPPVLLERIGLSGFHGVGARCLESDEIIRLSTIPPEGASARELSILSKAGLNWAMSLRIDDRPLGLLVLGSRDDQPGLPEADRQALRALQEAGAVALRNLERLEELQDLAVRTLRGLVAAAEIRSPEERGHAERVARDAFLVGRALKLAPGELRDLVYSAMLHDVGKVAVHEAVDDETDGRGRLHPVAGSRILSGTRPAAAVVQGVEQHHERWDGGGFPYGLRGDDIHVFARIIAVADAFDRMTQRDGLPADDALVRLERGAGLLWDPGIVAVFGAEVGRNPVGRRSDDTWLEELLGTA